MLSYNNLAAINSRLNTIFGINGDDSFFGDLPVILFGDFGQLPPVKGKPLFDISAAKPGGIHLYRDLFEPVVLDPNENFRATHKIWLEVLNKIRLGNLDENVKSVLHNLVLSNNSNKRDILDKTKQMSWLSLFAKRADKDKYNNERVEKEAERLNLQLFTITREEDQSNKKSVCERTIPLKIKLFKGARIMCLTNQNIEEGIVNGLIGNLNSIHVGREAISSTSYTASNELNIKVPKNLVLSTSEKQYKIEPILYSSFEEGRMKKFKMIPIDLAYAITIHKSQSMTLEGGVTDIGKSMWKCGGLAYTALSRFKSDENLCLLGLDYSKIFPPKGALEEMQRLQTIYDGNKLNS
jgi:ATP-dependent DNA helicase PIF1